MRRVAATLCGLAFLWFGGATVYLLLASSRTGVAASAMLAAAGGDPPRMPPLATVDGVWMVALLLGATLLAAVPAGVAVGHPPGLRATAWTVGGILVGCWLLTGPSVGLLYLPGTLLLLVAGAVGDGEADRGG